MIGFVTLVRLSLVGESSQAKTARQFISLFSDAKYKTKTSQVMKNDQTAKNII